MSILFEISMERSETYKINAETMTANKMNKGKGNSSF